MRPKLDGEAEAEAALLTQTKPEILTLAGRSRAPRIGPLPAWRFQRLSLRRCRCCRHSQIAHVWRFRRSLPCATSHLFSLTTHSCGRTHLKGCNLKFDLDVVAHPSKLVHLLAYLFDYLRLVDVSESVVFRHLCLAGRAEKSAELLVHRIPSTWRTFDQSLRLARQVGIGCVFPAWHTNDAASKVCFLL